MRFARTFLVAAAVASQGCGPRPDLARLLEVQALSTGWVTQPSSRGTNRIVPVVSFKLKNVSDRRVGAVQVNAVFRRQGDAEEWSTAFLGAAASRGLDPGATSGTLTATSPLGYTGTDPAAALLGNSQFLDASVDVFAKGGSTNWIRLGQFPIDRRLTRP